MAGVKAASASVAGRVLVLVRTTCTDPWAAAVGILETDSQVTIASTAATPKMSEKIPRRRKIFSYVKRLTELRNDRLGRARLPSCAASEVTSCGFSR
jgi:hypothetical protein